FLAAATVNGKIYAMGGTIGPTLYLNTVEVYDPANNSWCTSTSTTPTALCPTPPAPMPTARGYFAAATVNGKIYAIGGFNLNGGSLNSVEVYDPTSNSWCTSASNTPTALCPTPPAPMPTARYGLAAATVNGKIYAIGGAGGSNTVEVYDPATN